MIIISVFSLWALLKVIELVYVSMALMMFVPRDVQSYIFYNRCIHLVVFVFLCFTSLWIFHLIWVSIVEDDRVLISVQQGLREPGWARLVEASQQVVTRHRTLPEISGQISLKPMLVFVQPADVSVLFTPISEWVRTGHTKSFTRQKSAMPIWAKHRTCRGFLSSVEVLPLRHTQRSGRGQVVCCFENGDNCP